MTLWVLAVGFGGAVIGGLAVLLVVAIVFSKGMGRL